MGSPDEALRELLIELFDLVLEQRTEIAAIRLFLVEQGLTDAVLEAHRQPLREASAATRARVRTLRERPFDQWLAALKLPVQ